MGLDRETIPREEPEYGLDRAAPITSPGPQFWCPHLRVPVHNAYPQVLKLNLSHLLWPKKAGRTWIFLGHRAHWEYTEL